MNNFEIQLNIPGLIELRNSDEVTGFLSKKADEIIGKCSGNYEKSEYHGPSRANVSIFTTDEKTRFKNMQDNELIKALK